MKELEELEEFSSKHPTKNQNSSVLNRSCADFFCQFFSFFVDLFKFLQFLGRPQGKNGVASPNIYKLQITQYNGSHFLNAVKQWKMYLFHL